MAESREDLRVLGEISGLMAALYGLFGLIIGSFLNVCIDRIPLGNP
jgi:hypothetical protein